MNQISDLGFGQDINKLAGYGIAADGRCGNLDLVFENTGVNPATVTLKEFLGVGAPGTVSGYSPILPAPVVLVPKGTRTVSISVLSRKIGIFGSGNTTVNISTVIRNMGNLRGAQVDLFVPGRRGWSYEPAARRDNSPGYGPLLDEPSIPPVQVP